MSHNFDIRRDTPLVSVVTITYNHAPYIRQCLDGVLSQQTDFSFEYIVHDDASTDGTAEIVREYAEKYPNVIVPILQKENQYSKGKGLVEFILPLVRGKYRSLCEGDDYWIDPNKLQKQVDFLEAHADYGLVHGDCHIYHQELNSWEYNVSSRQQSQYGDLSKKELFVELLSARYKIRTATVLYRTELYIWRQSGKSRINFSALSTWLDLSQVCKFKYINEPLAVYRVLSESASHSKEQKKMLCFLVSSSAMRLYYSYLYGFSVDSSLRKRYNTALMGYWFYEPDYDPVYPLIAPTWFQRVLQRNRSQSWAKKIWSATRIMENATVAITGMPKRCLTGLASRSRHSRS